MNVLLLLVDQKEVIGGKIIWRFSFISLEKLVGFYIFFFTLKNERISNIKSNIDTNRPHVFVFVTKDKDLSKHFYKSGEVGYVVFGWYCALMASEINEKLVSPTKPWIGHPKQ